MEQKHIFIVNPIAGDRKLVRRIQADIVHTCQKSGCDWQLYETKAAGDARRLIRETEPQAAVRFYIVGGDGTLNEAVNGMMERGNGALGLLPCGTGDDFARFFPRREHFLDVSAQLEATSHPLDLLLADGLYGINMCNVGLDADTAADVHRFTRLFPGTVAYMISLADKFLHKMGKGMSVVLDGAETANDTFVLASFANGKSCGGGFFAAPRALLDDGYLEVGLVRPLKRLTFLRLVGIYKKGEHVDHPRFAPIYTYRRAKHVAVNFSEDVNFCIDGEIFRKKQVTIEIVPKALPFIIPDGVWDHKTLQG